MGSMYRHHPARSRLPKPMQLIQCTESSRLPLLFAIRALINCVLQTLTSSEVHFSFPPSSPVPMDTTDSPRAHVPSRHAAEQALRQIKVSRLAASAAVGYLSWESLPIVVDVDHSAASLCAVGEARIVVDLCCNGDDAVLCPVGPSASPKACRIVCDVSYVGLPDPEGGAA